jgi:hypothetical protein
MANGWCPFLTKMPLARPNYTAGRRGHRFVANVEHIADGYATLEGLHSWFSRVTSQDDPGSSAHAYNRRNGTGAQYISAYDSAWANGPVNRPDLTIGWLLDAIRKGVNPNHLTFTIEHEGKPGDVMTEAQYRLSLRVNRWALALGQIKGSNQTLIGHNQIDDVNRHYCPGPSFPWARLLTDVKAIPAQLPGLDQYEVKAWGPVYRGSNWIAKAGAPKHLTNAQVAAYEGQAWRAWYLAALFWLSTGDPEDTQDARRLLYVLGSSKDYHEVQPPTGYEMTDAEAYREAFGIFNGNKSRHGG